MNVEDLVYLGVAFTGLAVWVLIKTAWMMRRTGEFPHTSNLLFMAVGLVVAGYVLMSLEQWTT